MGAATALYSACCFACGKYENSNPYPINLSAVVGLSGWLPCAKFVLHLNSHASLILDKDFYANLQSGMFFQESKWQVGRGQ